MRLAERAGGTFATVALAAVVVAGCASVFGPRTIEVPKERLEQAVAQHFPVQRRVLDFVDLRAESPVVTLQPEANRIGVELVLTAGGGGVPRLDGSLSVSQALRYEPSDHTIRGAGVRVERFVLDGLPGGIQRRLDRLGKPIAEQLLENQVLYTLRDRDVAALEGRGVRPGDLRVTSRGLEVTLVPIQR